MPDDGEHVLVRVPVPEGAVDPALLEALAGTATSADLPLRGLRVHVPSLEEVFADITGHDDLDDPVPEPVTDDETSTAVAFEEEN